MEATLPDTSDDNLSAPPALTPAASAAAKQCAGGGAGACAPGSAADGEAWRGSLCSAAVEAVEWWRRAAARHVAAVRRFVRKLRRVLWRVVDSVLEEFEPWLKWVILDAVLALVVASLVRNVEPLRPVFEAVGWA